MNDSIILEARELAFAQRVRRESSKVWHLGDEPFTDAVRAYADGIPFAKIRGMLAEVGVPETDLPSQTAWVRFWGRFSPFLSVARRRAAVAGANAVAAEARQSAADFDAASIDLIRQLIYELASSGTANPRELCMLMSLVLKYEDHRLKERRVEVSERKMALAEKRQPEREEEKEDRTPMTPEEQERRMREIFGISDEWWARSQEAAAAAAARRESGDDDAERGRMGEGARNTGATPLDTLEHHETP